MKTTIFLCLILAIIPISSIFGVETILVGGATGLDPFDTSTTVSVGLAISGGGARGLSTIGILQAFEEKGIKVSTVAGTSMGGIIGGLFACGYSPDDLQTLVDKLAFDSLFHNNPSRSSMFLTQRVERDHHLLSIRFDKYKPVIPTSLTRGQSLTTLLTELTTPYVYWANSDFNKLQRPFKTVTTDILDGSAVIMDKGSLSNAMSASMAFPLAFSPIEQDGRLLMDGGIVVPIPVNLAKEMTPDNQIVVAVNTASSLVSAENLQTPIDIANQVTTIMTADKLAAQLALADFVITPDLAKYESTDFGFKDEIIKTGYDLGLKSAPAIIAAANDKMVSDNFTILEINSNSDNSVLLENLRLKLVGKSITKLELINFLKEIVRNYDIFELETQLEPLSGKTETNPYRLTLTTSSFVNTGSIHFSFEGNQLFHDSILTKQIDYSGEQFTFATLNRAVDRLLNFYQFNGMELANVKEIKINYQTGEIKLKIDEALISRIDVGNNHRTRDWFVRSNFTLKVGQAYSTKLATRGIENIYGTDLFDRVQINLSNEKQGPVVKIDVQEKHYQQVRIGWHWHEDYKSEEFIEILDDNVMGMGLEYLFHARYGPDRQKYFASFRANRIWSTYLTAQSRIYHLRLNRYIFDIDGNETGQRLERTIGASLGIGQQIARFGTVTINFVSERVKYRHTTLSLDKIFDLRKIVVNSMVENLDRAYFPTSGNRSSLSFTSAGKVLGGDYQFTRFLATFEGYLLISKFLNFHPKMSIGVSGSELPASEMFYLGGSESFMGFRDNQLPGDKLFSMSNELRIKLPYRFYLSFRHDIGEVYTHTDQIKLRNLRNGVGLKLSFDSPLGPFSIAHGIADSDLEQTYINVGFSF